MDGRCQVMAKAHIAFGKVSLKLNKFETKGKKET
jgi:hypothetical protein